MKKIKVTKYIGLTLGIALSIFAVNSVIHANWTAPLHSPPSCPSGNPGCDPPVHVGTSTQVKVGHFGVGGVFQTNSETHLAVGGGNVGIGTTAPGAKLEVYYGEGGTGSIISGGGSVLENIALKLWDTGTAANNINVLEFGHNRPYVAGARIRSVNPSAFTATGAHLILETASDNTGTWNSNQLVLDRNGNVGIGTATPGAKLHVAGNIIASDPTAANHVATKAYVDAQGGGGGGCIMTFCHCRVRLAHSPCNCIPQSCPSGFTDKGVHGTWVVGSFLWYGTLHNLENNMRWCCK